MHAPGLRSLTKNKAGLQSYKTIWEEAKRGRYEILTSTYSYLEVIHGVNEHGQAYPPEQYDEVVFSHLNQPFVERVVFDVEVAKLARALKRKHHPILGKRPDAVHLASAVFWNCSCLYTYDDSDLLPLHRRIPRRDGEMLSILAPGSISAGPLFDEVSQSATEQTIVETEHKPVGDEGSW